MPEDKKLESDPAIPLSRNETRPRPNPYTRLEAVNVIQIRLETLSRIAQSDRQVVDAVALAAVLEVLAGQLHVCLTGDLQQVEDIRDGLAPTDVWMETVAGLLRPSSPLRQ